MAIRPKQLSGAEAFLTLLNDEMLDRRTSFPAEVTAVNVDPIKDNLLSVNVLPLIQQTVAQDNTDDLIYRNLPILTNVPLVFPQSTSSGFAVTVPIQVGDQVLVVIADRSIDNWQSSGSPSRPAEPTTPRAHDLTDAIAIVGVSCDVNAVEQYDFDKICIRNGNKTKRVCVSNDQIEAVSAAASIILNDNEANVSIGNSSVVVDTNSITLSSNGNSIVINSSGVTINGSSVVINGVNFSTHTHISNGAGNPTDPPV